MTLLEAMCCFVNSVDGVQDAANAQAASGIGKASARVVPGTGASQLLELFEQIQLLTPQRHDLIATKLGRAHSCESVRAILHTHMNEPVAFSALLYASA